MNVGDLICTKNHKAVGIIERVSKHNVTTHILWNEPPFMQGCNVSTFPINEVEALPQGTRVIKNYNNGVKDELLYNFYDSDMGLIKDITGSSFTAWNLDGSCNLEFEFINDVSTKNNKQYTTLDIEPWDIMKADFTKEEFIGFLKGNIIKYSLRKKGSDLQDFEKIEHYARKLQEVLKNESN